MSNHSPGPDPEMDRHFRKMASPLKLKQLEELRRIIGGEPQPMEVGTHSQGKITKADQGDVVFRVGDKDGKVVLDFHEPMKWVGMTPEQAFELANSLIKRARKLGFSGVVNLTIGDET